MQDFILNEINDLKTRLDWLTTERKKAYDLYSDLSKKEDEIKKEITDLILENKLYSPIDDLIKYAGRDIDDIDIIYKSDGKLLIENFWCGHINDEGHIEYDDGDMEIEYDSENKSYSRIYYEPYSRLIISNVVGYLNLKLSDIDKE